MIGGKMTQFLAESQFLFIGDILTLLLEHIRGAVLLLFLHHFCFTGDVLMGTETLRSGKQFLTIFLKDLSSFQAIEWIQEESGLQALQLSQISWISSSAYSTRLYFSSLNLLVTVERSMGYLTTERQSVRPMPFQSTGSLKSKESLDSLRQLMTIFIFLVSSLSSLVLLNNFNEDLMLKAHKQYYIQLYQ